MGVCMGQSVLLYLLYPQPFELCVCNSETLTKTTN